MSHTSVSSELARQSADTMLSITTLPLAGLTLALAQVCWTSSWDSHGAGGRSSPTEEELTFEQVVVLVVSGSHLKTRSDVLFKYFGNINNKPQHRLLPGTALRYRARAREGSNVHSDQLEKWSYWLTARRTNHVLALWKKADQSSCGGDKTVRQCTLCSPDGNAPCRHAEWATCSWFICL